MTAAETRPPVHLWVYNHPFHGISDQVEYFVTSMRQNGYSASVGRQPRVDAQNFVIENFSESSSQILLDFCASTSKRVAVIMTEHLDFIEHQIYIHGDPLWSDNDYMHPATQVARIKNLLDCLPHIRCFVVLGDLPELMNIDQLAPGIAVRTLPFPHLLRIPDIGSTEASDIKTDVVFTGYDTKYRSQILAELGTLMSVASPRTFVSRNARDKLTKSAKIALNIPQRQGWRWLSLMRIIAALRCGRATVSLGTCDNSRISACCMQIDTSKSNWTEMLGYEIANWKISYGQAFERYERMATAFEEINSFPHDLLDYWAMTERYS